MSLIGSFTLFLAFGFSINTLTLFALTLAIGLVVDDAIVVVEAVTQKMQSEGLSPRDATRAAMRDGRKSGGGHRAGAGGGIRTRSRSSAASPDNSTGSSH